MSKKDKLKMMAEKREAMLESSDSSDDGEWLIKGATTFRRRPTVAQQRVVVVGGID